MKRCNLEETDNGIRLCRGLHDKEAPCEWEYFVSSSAVVDEREACAKACEEWRAGCDSRSMQAEGWAAEQCACLIRMRSNAQSTSD